jgi:hypothetical protein
MGAKVAYFELMQALIIKICSKCAKNTCRLSFSNLFVFF